MIKLLGIKRTVFLAILLAGNIFVAGAVLTWIMPMREDAETKLSNLKNQIFSVQNQLDNIKREMKELQETMPQYEALDARGFFQVQDRFLIEKMLEDIKGRSGVRGFSFSIDEVQTVDNKDAKTAKRNLVNSRIKIDRIEALLDTEIFNLIQIMESSYPAHLRVQSFSLRKTAEVTEPNLRLLTLGTSKGFVGGEFVVDWLTMVAPPEQPSGLKPGMPGYKGG